MEDLTDVFFTIVLVMVMSGLGFGLGRMWGDVIKHDEITIALEKCSQNNGLKHIKCREYKLEVVCENDASFKIERK